MFVAINNEDMNIFEVDAFINRTREANGGVISPEFAMEVLSKTNFHGHIKKVLKNIKENCTTREQLLPYKEFILSSVDGREMSENALKDLCELAKICECKEEFDKVNKNPKLYRAFDCEGVTVGDIYEFDALKGENLKVYFDTDNVCLYYCDLSKVKELKFKDGSEVKFRRAKNLPEVLDLSMCDDVNLRECDLASVKGINFKDEANILIQKVKNLPSDLDVSMCYEVKLSDCDLKGVKELKFREGAKVNLSSAKNLPSDLDVSMCYEVKLSDCDLKGVKELKFREGAKFFLSGVENLPKVLDVSMCSEVDLVDSDLSQVKEVKFKDGAKVNLSYATNLPENLDVSMCDYVSLSWVKNLPKVLDVSMCSEVDLIYSDFSEVKELKFKDGAKVDLEHASNLPENLDLSMCDEVDLSGCDLSGVKELKFKDKEQEKRFMEGAKNFEGKVVYAGDAQNIPAMVNSGMEM